MVSSTRFFTALFFIGAIVASPTLVSRAGVTRLTIEDIVALRPYALLARAAFCSPAKLKTWTCGMACKDLPEMVVQDAGGDGVTSPGWFVGYHPEFHTVVVSNQGTDPSEIVSSATDADFVQEPLDSSLFPGIDSSVQVHGGFKMSQAASAIEKLKAVEDLLATYGPSVTLTGLGRGGAISSLDALFLSLHLTNVNITLVTHGMPRVGNQAFANYVDDQLHTVSRITNKKDPLPTQPGRFLGYVHSSGEKHIVDATGEWVACAGQDNSDPQCSIGDVPNIFEGNLGDNRGPYDDITIDGSACDA